MFDIFAEGGDSRPLTACKFKTNAPTSRQPHALFGSRASTAYCARRIGEDGPVFLGAGRYDHSTPSALSSYVARLTSDDADLATATRRFEKSVCRLAGMDTAAAAAYFGGGALTHACALALKATGRRLIVASAGVNPAYLHDLEHRSSLGAFDFHVVPLVNGATDVAALVDVLAKDGERTAAVVAQYPNYYGVLERFDATVDAARRVDAALIVSSNLMDLPALKSPGQWGADLVVGDAQPTWLGARYGDGHLGFAAATESFMARLRASKTPVRFDEVELRSISELDASRAVVAVESLARHAFADSSDLFDAAVASRRLARFARASLAAAGFKFHYDAPFWREFAVKIDDPEGLNRLLLKWGVVGGLELEDGILIAFTEKRSKEEIEELVYLMTEHQFGKGRANA